jgi:hypothetical protein
MYLPQILVPTRPKQSPARRLALYLSTLPAVLLLSVTGCKNPATDELTSGVVSGERPVAMEGSEVFFGGNMRVKVTLSRGIGRGFKGKSKERDAYANNDDRTFVGSPLPPVTMHLILTNTGSETVTVKMLDFESDLGNFAIDPEMLTIAPGSSAEPTTMVSELGVNADVMPFIVTLKLGAIKETHTVSVRNVHVGAEAPAPAR